MPATHARTFVPYPSVRTYNNIVQRWKTKTKSSRVLLRVLLRVLHSCCTDLLDTKRPYAPRPRPCRRVVETRHRRHRHHHHHHHRVPSLPPLPPLPPPKTGPRSRIAHGMPPKSDRRRSGSAPDGRHWPPPRPRPEQRLTLRPFFSLRRLLLLLPLLRRRSEGQPGPASARRAPC